MNNTKNLDLFCLSVELFTQALKLRNKILAEYCINTLNRLFGAECAFDIVIAAMLEISKIAPDTFRWTLEHYNDFKGFSDLLESKSCSCKSISLMDHTDYNAEVFELNVAIVIQILKTQDKEILYSHEKNLKELKGYNYTAEVFIAALFQISELDPDIFSWAVKKLSDLDFYANLIYIVSQFATKKLVEKGFIPGKDFSANLNGQILINQNAKTVLLDSTSDFEDKILLQEILQVV